MLKNVLPALAAIVLVASSARADETLEFDLNSITDADITIEHVALDIDVAALEANTSDRLMAGEGDELDEAIGACFGRFGFGFGFGGGFGCGGGLAGFNCYRPIYRSFCFNQFNYCAPIVRRCVTPIYGGYWGCF